LSALFLAGLGLGLFLAAQVGPVTLLIVRSVLRGGARALLVGLAMAVAVAFVDVVYAALGLFGVAQLFGGGTVRLAFGLASGAILVAIGARTAWIGFRARAGFETAREVVLPRRAFFTAVAATALNPLTIALWTVSFPAAAPSSAEHAAGSAIAVLAGVALGTTTWYCGFAAAVALARKRVGDRLVTAIDVVTGCGLVAFGGLLGYRAIEGR
jgi:threonine/homoserine/homoserine lactone efflux protein